MGCEPSAEAEISPAAQEAWDHAAASTPSGTATALCSIKHVPMKLRQEHLGHSDARVTMGYTRLVSDDDRKLAAQLGKLLSVAPKLNGAGLASAAQSPFIQ
jgi:hypothetical protein